MFSWVLPLAWHLFEQRKPWRYSPLLLAPMLGYAGYFGLMYAWTGNPFEGFEAQRFYPYSPSVGNMFNAGGVASAFLNVNSLDGMMDSGMDRGFFVLFLALLVPMYRLKKTWFFYALPAGMPACDDQLFHVVSPVHHGLVPRVHRPGATASQDQEPLAVLVLRRNMAALQVWAVKQFICFEWWRNHPAGGEASSEGGPVDWWIGGKAEFTHFSPG